MTTLPYMEYVNVRIRSRFRGLIDRDMYENLIAGDDLGALTTFLLDREGYCTIVERALQELPEREGLERGVMDYFSHSVAGVMNLTSGALRRKFEYAVHQFDMRNLRSLVAAHHHEYEFARLQDMIVPCGTLDRDRLKLLYAAPDIPGMFPMLDKWYPLGADALRHATRKSDGDASLAGFLNRMEQYATAYLFGRLSRLYEDDRILIDLLRFEIDMKNILAALKHVWAGMSSDGEDEDVFIPGGNIRSGVLDEMVKKRNLDDVFEMIESTPFHVAIERGIIYYAETGLLNDMEHFFEEVFIRRAQRFRQYRLFSVGVFVGYLWAQYAEMTNLRTIINGIAFHSGPGQIKKGLVYV